MKKRHGFLAMLVCVLALGLVFVGCSNGSSDDGGSLIIGDTSATLTITGLGNVLPDEDSVSGGAPEDPNDYNGYYAFLMTDPEEPGYDKKDLFAAKNVNSAGLITLGKITENKVTLKVWEVSGNFPDISLQPYSGSHNVNLDIIILDVEEISLDDLEEAMLQDIEGMGYLEIIAFMQKYNMIAMLDGDALFSSGTGTSSSLSTELDIRWFMP